MASILFLSSMNGGWWGGSEWLWYHTAMRLARDGHEVACAAYDWPGKERRFAELRAARCEVFPIPNWRRRKATALDRLVHEGFAKPAAALAVRRLPWRRFDHVAFSQGGWDEITTRPFRFLDRLARTYSIAYHSYREQGTYRRKEDLRRLVTSADLNLFASARCRELLAEYLGTEPPHARQIHSPLSFPAPHGEPPWPGDTGPLRLVAVGTLHRDTKGHDVLLEALATARWRARPWTLEIWGEGPEGKELQALVDRLGLADRVRLRGHTTEIASALSAAHLLVQPSRVEAVGISVHEAMVLARPCVVTRIGDMPRWIRDGESGFVADRPEPAELARALDRAWEARPRLREMGRAGRTEFLERFPADPVGEFAGILLEAAGRR